MAKRKHPIVFLALSTNGVAQALGIHPRHVAAAIVAGDLEVRTIGVSRRIWVGDVEKWYREKWLKKTDRRVFNIQPKKVPHG